LYVRRRTVKLIKPSSSSTARFSCCLSPGEVLRAHEEWKSSLGGWDCSGGCSPCFLNGKTRGKFGHIKEFCFDPHPPRGCLKASILGLARLRRFLPSFPHLVSVFKLHSLSWPPESDKSLYVTIGCLSLALGNFDVLRRYALTVCLPSVTFISLTLSLFRPILIL
jgi:hypothetical protein